MSSFLLTNICLTFSQPPEGDWIVTGVETVENKTIMLNGNLTVKTGGRLTLRNITLTMDIQYDGQYGILVEPGASIFIYDSIIAAPTTSLRFSFMVQEATFVMKNSELHSCGWSNTGSAWEQETGGLLLKNLDNTVIEDNNFSDNLCCLVLSGTSNSIIAGNSFSFNDENAIYLSNSNNNTVSNNNFYSNLFGIHAIGSNRNTITNNTISNFHEGGVWLFNTCEGNIIENNTISAPNGPRGMPGWAGISIGVYPSHVANNNVVVNNSISGTKNGLEVHSSGNLLVNNSLTDVESGITLGYASRNIIANNNLSNVGPGWEGNAIELFHSSSNIIMNNRISSVRQTYGIILSGSSCNNLVQCNVIQSSPRGIGVFNSANSNEIVNNDVTLDRGYSIILSNSENNLVYGNNFVNEYELSFQQYGTPAYDNVGNFWYHKGKGNYWSDYQGNDEDNDDVSDIPYPIYPNGIDLYPSVKPLTLEHPSVPAPELVPPPEIEPIWPAFITDEQIWENQTLVFDSRSLIVMDGGNLTLRNVTLIIASGVDGIRVLPGGFLYIYDSKILPAEDGGGFIFSVETDAVFEMKNSELRGCGFCPHSSDWGGICVLTSKVTFENNTITDSYHGFYPQNTMGRVRDNVISDCYGAGASSLYNTVLNCVESWGRANFPLYPTQKIGPHGGFIRFNKALLEVPANVLLENTSVTINSVKTSSPLGYSIVGSVYDFEATEATFAAPAKMTLSYDDTKLPADWKEEEFSIWRKTNNSWENLGGTVDTETNKISLDVTRLSEYAILVVNTPPSADAGSPYTVIESKTVKLDGTRSSDPDDDTLTYSWTIMDDPTGKATLTQSLTSTPSFNAPPVDSDTDVTVELTVDDGHGNTDSDTTTITIHQLQSSVEPTDAEPTEPIEPEPTGPSSTEPEEPAPTGPEESGEAEPTEPEPTEPEPTAPETTEPEVTAPVITTEIAIIIAVVVVAVISIVAFWALKKRR